MTTIKLTTADYRDVTRRAVDTAFKTKEAELVREEHDICRQAWELVFPEAERRMAAKMPAPWTRRYINMPFRFGYRRVVLKNDGTLPCPDYSNDLGLVQDPALIARVEALDSAKVAVRAERERAEAAVGALVRRATTLKRLGEIWPEGAPHYAHLAARAQHPVPAVQVDAVNAMLGLPEPGTAP